MPGKDKVVMRSIEAPGGQVCVDLYRHANGSWGWSTYRRDPEDGRGWQDAGAVGCDGFATEADALASAVGEVAWLADSLKG